ncbi:hypothetical protein Y1Q_0000414 [Alligator mississippiensis]|uniref:Uncharacterized protein n=1 Tax=Alligator mississippiensis TaxID=8496 RepID=A0A151MB41_ALLMI|nr:hypothetical protein Y1Q_0000414 [Alligator mississippiensis]
MSEEDFFLQKNLKLQLRISTLKQFLHWVSADVWFWHFLLLMHLRDACLLHLGYSSELMDYFWIFSVAAE